MSAEMMPLYWRIGSTEQNGVDGVSLLMPARVLGETPSEFPTEVFMRSHRDEPANPVDLRWSDEDSDLFLNLLDRVVDVEDEPEVTLDLNDGVVQGIVQLVAMARFKAPWSMEELLGDDINTIRTELEIGDLVAINTIHGFVQAIVVGMDSIDATCVLLSSIKGSDHKVIMSEQSLVVVNRLCVLPAVFASDTKDDSYTIQ